MDKNFMSRMSTDRAGSTKRLSTVQEKIQNTVANIATHEPGQMVSWQKLYEWFDTTNRKSIQPHIGQVKRILEETHGLFLEAVPNQGYLIKPRGEEIDLVRNRIALGIRACVRGTRSAQLIRAELIPDQKARNETIAVVAKIQGLKFLSLQGEV